MTRIYAEAATSRGGHGIPTKTTTGSKCHKHGHTSAAVAMAKPTSSYGQSDEETSRTMFIFQQQQQTNHRKILPKFLQWNPTPHLGDDNLQPHASTLDLYNLNASLAFSSTDYTTGGMFGAPPSGSGSPTIAQNMGLLPLGVCPSSAGAQSWGFMGTSAMTPNLGNMNTLPGSSVAHLLGQTPTPSFRPWNSQ